MPRYAVNLFCRKFLGGTPWKREARASKGVLVTLSSALNTLFTNVPETCHPWNESELPMFSARNGPNMSQNHCTEIGYRSYIRELPG